LFVQIVILFLQQEGVVFRRCCQIRVGIREPDLMVLLSYAKLARISLDILANDSRELIFPKRWKRPRRAKVLLMQERVNETDEQF
jgi:hypothetical protein